MPHDDHSHPPGVPHKHPYQDDLPEPESYYQLLRLALHEVLVEKGVYSSDDMRAKGTPMKVMSSRFSCSSHGQVDDITKHRRCG